MPQVTQVRAIERRKRRMAALVVAFGVAVVVSAVGGWLLYKHNHSLTISGVDNVQNQANEAVSSSGGKLSAGLSVYDKAISQAADNQTKASLELKAATLAVGKNASATALPYAQKADAILKSDSSSGLLAEIYLQQGNTAQAVKYFNLAAREVQVTGRSSFGKQYYLDLAQQASGGQQ